MSFSELEARTVVRSVGEFHVGTDGSTSLLRVALDFGDGARVTLASASDGQSLQVGSEVLRDYDMERYGRTEIRELGLPTGAHVREAVPMVDADGLTFGVLLRAEERDVFVFSWGDDLYAQESLPAYVRAACTTPLPV
jgi:hypothetical protein